MIFFSRPNRRDRNLLTEFQQKCALYLLDLVKYGPAKAPEHLLGYSAMARRCDPRPMLSEEISATLRKAGKKEVDCLGKKEAEPLITLAKSALLSDPEFETFAQSLPSGAAQSARDFRNDWSSAIARYERLQVMFANYAELVPLYVKQRAIAPIEGDLLSYVKSLNRDGWHRFICDCDWDDPEASDILPAAAWILSQPDCDRWTAVAFLAVAQASAIDDGDRDHLVPALAQETMAAVSDRLRDGFYKTGEFVVVSNAQGDVELARTGADAAAWRFPFHWDQIGDPGTTEPDTRIVFCRNRPVKSFETWLSDTGREL